MRSLRWLVAGLIVSGALACGRTVVVRFTSDASVVLHDAGHDAGVDAGTDAGLSDAACEPRVVGLIPAVPTVMFVLDRSGSMADDLNGRSDGGGPSRWSVLEQSLNLVLPPRNQQMAMGALMYPSPNSDACDVPTAVDLSPSLGNATPILNLFITDPLGGTPTWAAIDLAARHLATLRTASSARALVVTTDGAPNCNSNLNPFSCTCTLNRIGVPPQCENVDGCLDDQRTILELNDLFRTSSLPTYVVGLGTDLNLYASTLDAMAVAGGVPRMGTGHRYYSAASQAELTDAFTRITSQLSRCTFLINSTISINDTLRVMVDNSVVPQGPNGWEWLNRANGEITLYGTACDRAAAGAVATALVECP